MIEFGAVNWRDSGRALRAFGVDGRIVFLLLLFLFRIRWWTFWLLIITAIVLFVFDRMGYTIPNALRRIRVLLTAPRKPAVRRSRVGRSDR